MLLALDHDRHRDLPERVAPSRLDERFRAATGEGTKTGNKSRGRRAATAEATTGPQEDTMKTVSVTAVVLLVALLAAAAGLDAADAPAKRMVSGEVVSLYAYLARGAHGVQEREAGVFQVEKRGLPIAIVEDGTGDIYVAVAKGPASAVAKLAPMMGMEVNVQGPVWEKKGLKLIEIEVVSEQ
jgi:hypothetical protein